MAGNMKAVKLRIKSVQSTMQITKAMELVASSKLRKAKERAETCRPYFTELHETLKDIARENIDFFDGEILEISAKEETGIEEMEERIYNYILEEDVEDSSEKLVITNIRHKSALEKTKEAVENIFETIDSEMPMDLISVDLKEALDSLSEITGEISSEDILAHVFSNFCVAK